MNAQRTQFPTTLANTCERFVGKQLSLELRSGWGWGEVLDGVHKPLDRDREAVISSGTVRVCVERFFRGVDSAIRGFVGSVVPSGHRLDNFKVVLFTMADGIDFDFNGNVCMVWGAWFGDREPSGAPGTVPEFTGGVGYKGYGTVYDDEAGYRECVRRLQLLDPRKTGSVRQSNQ
ncbi:MAG TPA: hypothetical protein VN281_13980 [Verrucomicrobiae bacterium]|nr:hypothetical protein [Verrucomicrobiae bacterium]